MQIDRHRTGYGGVISRVSYIELPVYNLHWERYKYNSCKLLDIKYTLPTFCIASFPKAHQNPKTD
jgi:hypothetical protein